MGKPKLKDLCALVGAAAPAPAPPVRAPLEAPTPAPVPEAPQCTCKRDAQGNVICGDVAAPGQIATVGCRLNPADRDEQIMVRVRAKWIPGNGPPTLPQRNVECPGPRSAVNAPVVCCTVPANRGIEMGGGISRASKEDPYGMRGGASMVRPRRVL